MKTSYFQIVFLLLLFASCSPQRRLERLVSRHPELRTADTMLIRDTIIQPPVSADTLFPLTRLIDTLVITRDRLEIKLVRKNDTIHVKGTCKADTIIRTLRIPVERIKYIKTETKKNILVKFIWIAAGLMVIGILVRIKN